MKSTTTKQPPVRKATEIGQRPIRMLVYGEPGVGKTTLLATAPKPLLVIDFEAGADIRLQGQEGIDILTVYSYQELKEYLDWIRTSPYTTVAFDGFSVFVQQTLREILQERQKASPTFYEWGLLSQRVKEVILSLLKPQSHTIFTALKKKRDQDGQLTWTGPDLPKSIREMTRAIVDFEAILWEKEGKRFLGFISIKGVAEVKDRSGKLTVEEPADITAILQKVFTS